MVYQPIWEYEASTLGKDPSAQFDVGEGPSRDAFSPGQPVLMYGLARTDGRWPAFVSGALARGMGAVYAFPLQLAAARLGVLTCYSARPRALGKERGDR